MSKQRHGCLSAWLVLFIVANALTGLIYLFGREAVAASLPSSRTWAIPVDIILAAANLIFAIALFQWKRWGFFGLVATAIAAFAVNVAIGANMAAAIAGLLSLAILYGVLQIGGDRKGWAQLE